MKNIVLICCIALLSHCSRAETYPVLVTVKRNYTIPKTVEQSVIVIDWKTLVERIPELKKSCISITDQNTGKSILGKRIDNNNDKATDYLVFDYTFESNEPVFSFLIQSGKEKVEPTEVKNVSPDSKFSVAFLTPFLQYEKQQGKVTNIASKIVQSTINLYPDVKDFPIYAPRRWNYEYSFFLAGSYKLGKETNNQAFVEYPRKWLDDFIEEDGKFRAGVYKPDEYKLDDVIPARLAIWFHQETKLSKYKSIADTIALQLEHQPKTSDGGYWHKKVYTNQMWLDGIFMADVFSMQYAQAYNKPALYDEAVHQIKLIYKHTLDPKTGLLYHGWDESKNPVWANPQTGASPEFWSRAIGWYVMALTQCLDYLPTNHPERNDVIKILQDVSAAVKKYQDPKTNNWFQVIDKGTQPGNWLETSSSAMFAYAFAKAHHQGFLDKTYLTAAEQAYNGLLAYVYVDDAHNLHFDQTVKIGTLNPKGSKGDYAYYISTERRINDYKGLASFLYASMELNR